MTYKISWDSSSDRDFLLELCMNNRDYIIVVEALDHNIMQTKLKRTFEYELYNNVNIYFSIYFK